VQLAEHDQVLPAGQQGIDGGVLGGQADPPPHLCPLRPDVEPRHRGLTLVGLGKGGEDAHCGGLARSVGAQHRGGGARRDLEVYAVEGDRRSVALDEAARFHGVAFGHRGSRGRAFLGT
jgi:hypothetical protein